MVSFVANTSYHLQARLYFQGALNVQALEDSLKEIVRRYEICRTTFEEIEGQTVPVVHEHWLRKLSFADLSALPSGQVSTILANVAEDESYRLRDMTQLPLIRWTLLRLSCQCFVLLHVAHHRVDDIWPFSLFLDQLMDLYESYTKVAC